MIYRRSAAQFLRLRAIALALREGRGYRRAIGFLSCRHLEKDYPALVDGKNPRFVPSSARGRLNENEVPLPNSLSTQILP